MNPEFWHQRWAGHQIGFHQSTPTPLVLAVGGLETDGFKNQTLAYETAWRAQNYPVARVDTPHCNHFNLVSELALPDSPLTQATLKMIQG